MGYAFISYSSRNLDDALAMRSVLMNRGIKTWMAPGDIPAGSTYAGVITRAIKSAECLVLLLTDDSQNSKWVDKEVERALSYGRTVIPVALDDLVLNDNFEFYLGNQQIVPVKQISDDNGEFLRIVDQIVKLTGTEAVGECESANAGLRDTGNLSRVKSLTPSIPLIPEVGLIGRDDIVNQVRTMLDSNKSVALVSGLGGIGKTAVMAQICNSIMSEGRQDTYVAWITCGESYIDDLLTLRQKLGIPKDIKREEAYEAVIGKLQDLQGTLYIFFDDMARVPDKAELGTYNALRPNVRIMITSRHEIKGTQGDYEKAQEYYEKALAVRKVKLGEAHPYTQNTQRSVQKMEQIIKRKSSF